MYSPKLLCFENATVYRSLGGSGWGGSSLAFFAPGVPFCGSPLRVLLFNRKPWSLPGYGGITGAADPLPAGVGVVGRGVPKRHADGRKGLQGLVVLEMRTESVQLEGTLPVLLR